MVLIVVYCRFWGDYILYNVQFILLVVIFNGLSEGKGFRIKEGIFDGRTVAERMGESETGGI